MRIYVFVFAIRRAMSTPTDSPCPQILYRVEHIFKRLLLERFYQKYGPDSPERNLVKLKHYYLITMRDLRLSDVVDTIAGTSTGAIMAGYLAAQVGNRKRGICGCGGEGGSSHMIVVMIIMLFDSIRIKSTGFSRRPL